MTSLISRLDEVTINQITAGEVIENSSSVVKELVENAIDAKAYQILIEIQGGGRQLIRISDDGMGMSKDDALLCFERHATSKLKTVNDFESLYSLGFRGEALAAISSISQVQMMTRLHQENQGTFIELEAGRLINTQHIPCNCGTTIEIKNLFFNSPVRKKFLKSPKQENAEILKAIYHLILAHPEINFQLIIEKEEIFKTLLLKGNFTDLLKKRIEHVLHEEWIKDLQPLYFEENGIKIEGYIGTPQLHRSNKTGQYLYINQRPVVSWIVSKAVLEGYGTTLPENRFPVFVLHFSIPAHSLDVNVHPQKKEVRFRFENSLREAIRQAVASCWAIPEEFRIEPSQFSSHAYVQEIPSGSFLKESQLEIPLRYQEKQNQRPQVLATMGHYGLLNQSPLRENGDNSFCLMACNRAKERVYYEYMMQNVINHTIEKQLLLLPLTFDLSSSESQELEYILSDLHKIGFEIRKWGGQKGWVIESFPIGFNEKILVDMIKGWIKELSQVNKKTIQETRQKELVKRSVASLFHSQQKIQVEEIEKILTELLDCQQPFFSPFGEPIFVEIGIEEIRKFFL